MSLMERDYKLSRDVSYYASKMNATHHAERQGDSMGIPFRRRQLFLPLLQEAYWSHTTTGEKMNLLNYC